MRMRKPWSEEMKDLILKGYKFDNDGNCIFDPTAPIIVKTIPVVAKPIIVEPRASQVAKKAIVKVKPKKRGK